MNWQIILRIIHKSYLNTLSLFLMLIVQISGCAYLSKELPKEVYRAYSGSDIPDVMLATLEMGNVDWVRIDGKIVVEGAKYSSITLQPGMHQVVMGHEFGGSPLVMPKGSAEHASPIIRAPLEGGQTYKCLTTRTYGPGYKVFFWIINAKTGELIAGRKPPTWFPWGSTSPIP